MQKRIRPTLVSTMQKLFMEIIDKLKKLISNIGKI